MEWHIVYFSCEDKQCDSLPVATPTGFGYCPSLFLEVDTSGQSWARERLLYWWPDLLHDATFGSMQVFSMQISTDETLKIARGQKCPWVTQALPVNCHCSRDFLSACSYTPPLWFLSLRKVRPCDHLSVIHPPQRALQTPAEIQI